MPEFLLELFSEEIPARMQAQACRDLERLMATALGEARLACTRIEAFATPRRLALMVEGLPARQPDLTEERRGPRVDAPEKAIAGFKSALPAGARVDEREEAKGRFLHAVIEMTGAATRDVLAGLLPGLLRTLPWPKSMRSGDSEFRWVRPLQSILCVFDGALVPFTLDTLAAGTRTRGHRFLAPVSFEVQNFADYKDKLKKAKVILDPEARRGRIREKAKKLAREAGLELIEDEAMVAENAGLTEWPYPLIGGFDPEFLEVPEEVLVSAMRGHQKYLTLRDPATGRLAPRFICVANTQAADGGAAIVAGNERVLSARLSDARFFWQQDLKIPLDTRVEDLKRIVFHDKLGTVAERVERIEALAVHIAEAVDFGSRGEKTPHPDPLPEGEREKSGVSDTPRPSGEREGPIAQQWEGEGLTLVAQVRRATRLAKADLVTGLVGEFPELQGTIGRRLAEARGEPAAVARAIEEHYAPRGPEDSCPSDPVSVCVALAEKLDTLVGFFAIGEKPTGSKDPFALRRAALGVIRLIVENGLRVELLPLLDRIDELHGKSWSQRTVHGTGLQARLSVFRTPIGFSDQFLAQSIDMLAFFADRLKVQQREKGVRHDLIDAVFSLGGEDDLVRLLARVAALQAFVGTEDGAQLLAGYKRAANILKIEGKKDGDEDRGAVDAKLLEAPAEKALHERLGAAAGEAQAALEVEDFAGAMRALASLRPPIDAFFDAVTVNADAQDLRRNRLALLAQIRAAVHQVADFSKVEG